MSDEQQDEQWWDGITDVLTNVAEYVGPHAEHSTILRGSIVTIGDEVLVNAAPLVRNVVFDARFVNDPNLLLKTISLPAMSEDGVRALWAESDARREPILPLMPLMNMAAQIVTATFMITERLTGLDLSDEEAYAIQRRYYTVAMATSVAVLSMLEDFRKTSEMFEEDDDE